MGNYRFRLSDMIPNAWFYKLKDVGRRSRKKYSSSSSSSSSHLKRRPPTSSPVTSNSQKTTSRYSYYITNQPIQRQKFSISKSMSTQFNDPPRKSSSKRRTKRKTIYKPSPKPPTYSPDYSSSSPFEYLSKSEEDRDHGFVVPQSFDRQVSTWASSSMEDIIIDMEEEEREPFAKKSDKVKGFSSASKLDLPPILTKPTKSVRTSKDQAKTMSTSPAPARKSLSNSTGIRLRSNYPRIAPRKQHQPGARKSLSSAGNGLVSDSFVVVKSSLDPKRDFRDSMVEMIVENNIRTSKDLEELLACYLSLNSNEYHDLIVKALEDIWLDMAQLRL